jgi:hypothetical protein
MAVPELEEFAKILIQQIRDEAVRSSDNRLCAGHVVARRWKEAAVSGSAEVFAKTLIPDIVDDTIFYFLRAIDEGLLKLSFISSNAKAIDLSAEGQGELAGLYMGSGEWRAKYSKERFVDDFADLKGFVGKSMLRGEYPEEAADHNQK